MEGILISKGVQREDVLQATRIIRDSAQLESAAIIGSAHIGSRLNEWQMPISEYGSDKVQWEAKLKASPYLGDMDFGRNEWARAREAADAILDLIMKEIRVCATKYEGLIIEKYIRQGSSRDGLKVIAPAEFDTMLLFHIEGLDPKAVQMKKDGKIIPGFCQMEISQSLSQLQSRFPKLYREGVFHQTGDIVTLNARMLHQGVFQSIIDTARERVMQKVQTAVRDGDDISFEITRSMNAPSVNITIHLGEDVNRHFMRSGQLRTPQQLVRKIDVDIVPALLIRNDQVPDPSNRGQTMNCPVFAKFKWMKESSAKAAIFQNPEIIWFVCLSGYEKHTMDLARCDRRQQYIITALRILKTYFSKTKANRNPPLQIATVLKSYDLKQIAFYLIVYLCYIHKEVLIDGVGRVMCYFFEFLSASLEKKRLPHFFHSCELIRHIYPEYPINRQGMRFNLFRNTPDEALNQALISFKSDLLKDFGYTIGTAGPTGSAQQQLIIKQEFLLEISEGEYF